MFRSPRLAGKPEKNTSVALESETDEMFAQMSGSNPMC